MALPFDRLNPADREIIANLKAQTASLNGQTKVLHSLSAEIIRQGRKHNDFREKTAKDFQKIFSSMGGSGFSDIKSFLRTGGDSKARGSNKTDPAGQPDKGFFKNLFTKVFGPSKYQTKVMEEITLLRELSERQTRHLEFIAEQNTDSKRAKEREALATAIVNKMKFLDFGGDSEGLGSGLLKTLGKSLLLGIGGAIALLGRQLSAALRGVLAGLKLALKGLETLLEKIWQKFPKFPPTTGPVPGGGGGGPAPIPEPVPGGGGGSPPIVVSPGGPRLPGPARLPGPNTPPLLEGAKPAGRSGGFNPNASPFNQPWKGRFQPPTDVGGRFSPGGLGKGVALALIALAAALGYKMTMDDDTPSQSDGSVMSNGDPVDAMFERFNQRRQIKELGLSEKKDMYSGEALDIAGKNKFITDPFTGQQVTVEQFKNLHKDKLTPEQNKKLDAEIKKEKDEEARLKKEREKQDKLQQEKSDKERKQLEEDEKGLNLQENFNEALQGGINALENFTESTVKAITDKTTENFIEKTKKFLNKLGEISIQGQKINLAPGLGDAMATTIKESTALTKELIDYTKETMTGGNTNNTVVTNNNVNNVSNGGSVSLPANNAKTRTGSGDAVLDMFGMRK